MGGNHGLWHVRDVRRLVVGSLILSGALAAFGLTWWRSGPRRGDPPGRQPPRKPWSRRAPSEAGVLWDWSGIIGTGQSLSVGVSGEPILSRAPAYENLKLDLGGMVTPPYDAEDERLRMVLLTEPIRPLTGADPAAYPHNICGETPHTAMAHQISTLARAHLGRDCVTTHSVVGESGMGITIIGRDAKPERDMGHAWAASLFEARAIARLAKAAGKSYGVAAIVLTHGESDAERIGYAAELRQLWHDYNADLSAITGQTQTIPLLLTQQSSVPSELGTVAVSTLAAWRVVGEAPADIVCVGPRYQYEYAADRVHLTALSYARLGEKYGQVLFQHVLQRRPFRPLEPLEVQRRGSDIVVRFHVPVPPLRWHEALATPDAGRGFELLGGGERVAIARVELEGADSVVIKPALEAQGALQLRYALSAREPRPRGTVRWGALCDSDPFVGSHTRTAQANHAVAFELDVP